MPGTVGARSRGGRRHGGSAREALPIVSARAAIRSLRDFQVPSCRPCSKGAPSRGSAGWSNAVPVSGSVPAARWRRRRGDPL